MSSSSPLLFSLLGACVGATPEPGAQTPALVATASASAPEKPMITRTQAGLADAHVAQPPLLDRIELHRNEVRGTRTYDDGTQYLIHQDPNVSDAGAPAWTRFVTITPTGVERIRQVVRSSVLAWQEVPPSAGPSSGGGTIVWVVHVDGQERVVETRSGNYNALPAWVRELDEAVSTNVVPAG